MVERVREGRWLLVPTLVVAGVVIGLLVAFVFTSSRRAQADVLISSATAGGDVTPLLSNVQELASGGVLAGNVRSTLRLHESAEGVRHRIRASIRPHSDVIVLTATAGSADRARQLAQEAAVVLTQLVGPRFRQVSPPLRASLLDPGHVVSGGDRHLLRDMFWGAVAGLLLGLLGAALLPEREAVPALPASAEAAARELRERDRDLNEREKLLEQRVKLVTEREVKLARRAGELAAKDVTFSEREREIAERERKAADAESLALLREPEPEPEPEREPEPAPEPVVIPVEAAGRWNLDDLERRVNEQPGASPEQIEERRMYLFYLRAHADIDGRLPPSFDTLIAEVFGELTLE